MMPNSMLNFLNGTVDLRIGELRPHAQKDLITKLIHFDYRPDATCPEFLRFLARVTGGAQHLIDYLRRAIGYSITGLSSEKCLFVAFGKGNTGKSTLLHILSMILREYSTVIQSTSLLGRRDSNTIQSDLADLNGARFVITSKPPSGAVFAAGTLKRLTQGIGNMKARRLHENPRTFKETYTIWADCNKLPRIDDPTDQAAISRLNPIQFASPTEGIDDKFPERLLAEAGGILAWCVAGAVEGYTAVERGESRLQAPREVDEWRDHWRENAWLSRFIGAELKIDPTLEIQSAHAYDLLKRFWNKSPADEPLPTHTAFGIEMKRRFRWAHKDHGTVYLGVGRTPE